MKKNLYKRLVKVASVALLAAGMLGATSLSHPAHADALDDLIAQIDAKQQAPKAVTTPVKSVDKLTAKQNVKPVKKQKPVRHHAKKQTKLVNKKVKHVKRNRKAQSKRVLPNKKGHYYYRKNGHWYKYRTGHYNRNWKWISNKSVAEHKAAVNRAKRNAARKARAKKAAAVNRAKKAFAKRLAAKKAADKRAARKAATKLAAAKEARARKIAFAKKRAKRAQLMAAKKGFENTIKFARRALKYAKTKAESATDWAYIHNSEKYLHSKALRNL